MNDRMVWIDCEMTGLSLSDDALIEVAALVTDSELNVLGEGVDIVIRPPDAALETMPEVVRQMHTASGLLEELAGGTTLQDAEEQVLAYVREYVKEPGKAPLCGNSVGTDRGFLLRESIAELRYYREAVFVPQPGPDSDTAKAIAAKYVMPAQQG
jgi:oligoribonuclease